MHNFTNVKNKIIAFKKVTLNHSGSYGTQSFIKVDQILFREGVEQAISKTQEPSFEKM